MDTGMPVLGALRALALCPEDDHRLDRLAQRFGQSKFHLQRKFARQAGESPKQFARRLRIERAAVALASGNGSILTVALDTGFASHESFTRAFRSLIGCTPREYRARCKSAKGASQTSISGDLVRAVGPCLRLYQTNFRTEQERSFMPTSEIALATIERQPILFIRRRVARTQLQPLFAECFPKIFQHCSRSGIAVAGQPVARYISVGQGLWTVDCAIPVSEDAPPEGEIEAGELRAGPAAIATHSGDYGSLGETHAAIETWIEANGLKSDGPPWESYVTSPAEVPGVADWRTEVFWPLADTGGGSKP
jgi:AraC family transcriptional regulator